MVSSLWSGGQRSQLPHNKGTCWHIVYSCYQILSSHALGSGLIAKQCNVFINKELWELIFKFGVRLLIRSKRAIWEFASVTGSVFIQCSCRNAADTDGWGENRSSSRSFICVVLNREGNEKYASLLCWYLQNGNIAIYTHTCLYSAAVLYFKWFINYQMTEFQTHTFRGRHIAVFRSSKMAFT